MQDNLLENLNPEQVKAVMHEAGPLMIIAGAGTGKTTVITHRIGWLIEQKKAKPDEILALTFTEKAAAEMEERVDRLLPYGYVDLWISTFHSFCERILKQHGLDVGLPNDFKLLNQTDAWLLVRQNFERFNLDYYRPAGNPTKFIHAMLTHFSRAKDENVTPEEYLDYVEGLKANKDTTQAGGIDATELSRLEELAGAYHTYQQILLENNALDFGDLISYTLKLFNVRPKILNQYQQQFKFVMVDEFQDTNWAQYELVKMLALPTNNITVVCDDDQCLPGDAQISTPNGPVPIKKINIGDDVHSAFGKGHLGISRVTHVARTQKDAQMIEAVTQSGKKVIMTDNHKVFCYVPQKSDRKTYYVYLMLRRDLGWRIGVTNDLVVRIRLERSADYVVALRAFKTETEARYFETLCSLRYGIPTVCFKERDGLVVKGELLKKLYQELTVADGAARLAKELNIDLDGFHFCLGAVTRGSSQRVKIVLTMLFRRYRSKEFVRSGRGVLHEAPVSHKLALETSDPNIIAALRKEGISLLRAKVGYRIQMVGGDLPALMREARRLEQVTGGILEVRSSVGRLAYQTRPAVVIPAKNLVEGFFLPTVINGEVRYDRIVSVSRYEQTDKVYDLEIAGSHNYIADGVVVHNSIYKFRGASVSNVLQFKSDYPDAEQIALTMNYRSLQKILDTSYSFIQSNNPNRLETQLEGLTKRLTSGREGTGTIEHMHAATLDDEARQTVDRIFALHQSGVPLSEFAILVRANDSAEPFIQHLEMRGVPYQFMALRGLYRKPIILDALALLRVIDHPYHSQSMYRILSHPAMGIKADDLVKLTHECYRRGKSLVDVMELAMTLRSVAPETSEHCAHLLQLFARLRSSAARKPVSELFVEVAKESGLLGYVGTLSERDQQENFRFLQQLYERMKGFESVTADHSLKRFLEELEHEQASGDEGALKMDPEIGPETVKIMTVHAAKGLEFGHVFIVNLVDRRFPTSEKKDAIPLPDALIKEKIPEGDIHLEEERRLMYVALTRAKDAVYLTSAEDYGGVRKKKLSRFLVEMGFEAKESKPSLTKALGMAPRPDRYSESNAHVVIPKAFSYTQLAAFETCPLQYKFAHILHVPVFGRYQMSFGKTMHGTLQKFFEIWKERSDQPQQTLFDAPQEKKDDCCPVKLEELLKLYDEQWIDEWYENDKQREDYRDRGRKSLREYYAELEQQPPRPLHLEKGFTVKFGDVTVRGRIDRVDAIEGGVEIIDYKTGKPKTELEADEKRQLMIYQIAAMECFNPSLMPTKLTYHYLEDNSRVSFIGTPEQLDELRAEIVATAQAIRTSDFKATPSFMCDYCDFKDICEFRQK